MNSITFIASVGLTLTILLGILGLIHITNDFNMSTDQSYVRTMVQEQNNQNKDVEILNQELTKPLFGNWKVEGKIQNSGTSQIRYSVISIKFLDERGILLNSSSTKLNNLKPGEVRDFKVDYRGKIDPSSYNLETRAF